MAAPGFGFSVGDFTAAIQLAVKIAKAFRETTGAPAQFQQAALELEGIAVLLRSVQSLPEEPSRDDAIRQAQTV